jgi:hypothetical protein
MWAIAPEGSMLLQPEGDHGELAAGQLPCTMSMAPHHRGSQFFEALRRGLVR